MEDEVRHGKIIFGANGRPWHVLPTYSKVFSRSLSSEQRNIADAVPRFQERVLLSSNMTQMTLANVPNDIFAFKPCMTPLPPAVNQDICFQLPDTMCIPEMCRDTLACDLSAASFRDILTSPSTRRRF